MKKRNKLIYWIATVWLSLGMTSSAIVQLLALPEESEMLTELGYPLYIQYILGTWKLLGVIVILLPKLPLLKEWAYAGFFFAMSGACISHLIMHDPFGEVFPSLFLILLTALSWYFRPPARRLDLTVKNA